MSKSLHRKIGIKKNMKHLIRFNESVDKKEPFDYDYIKICFIDLIESGVIKYEEDDYLDNDGVTIKYVNFSTPDSFHSKGNEAFKSIDKYIKSLEVDKDNWLNIKTAISRIKDEYPNYKITSFYDDGLEYGEKVSESIVKIYIREL
jgi:hypothetical protein